MGSNSNPRHDVAAAWKHAETSFYMGNVPQEVRLPTDVLEQIFGGVEDGDVETAIGELVKRSDATNGLSGHAQYDGAFPVYSVPGADNS